MTRFRWTIVILAFICFVFTCQNMTEIRILRSKVENIESAITQFDGIKEKASSTEKELAEIQNKIIDLQNLGLSQKNKKRCFIF